MAAQLAVAAHRLDDRALPRLQRVERELAACLRRAARGPATCGYTARGFAARCGFAAREPSVRSRTPCKHALIPQRTLRRTAILSHYENLVPRANFQLLIVARNGRERKDIFPNG